MKFTPRVTKKGIIRTTSVFVLLFMIVSGIIYIYPSVDWTINEKPIRFWDSNLPLEERIDDLMSRLTLNEKIGLLLDTSPPIQRLGIPAHYVGNEALHGIVRPGNFTVFPQSIGLGAAFSPELIYLMMAYASDEARGRHNAQGRVPTSPYSGLLTFFSPDVNIARDPRWGRTAETYGEDPLLCSLYAEAFVKGLQGTPYNEARNWSQTLKCVATPKHFVANNEEDWVSANGTHRTRFNSGATIDERWLYEYYLPPFKAAVVDGGAESIMSAYNSLNGVPCCANRWLLTDLLRNQWGFQGYVVTDCGGIGQIHYGHHYVKSIPAACGSAIRAGVDLECGSDFKDNVYKALLLGYLSQAELDQAVRRVLRARFRLGLFDPIISDPYASLNESNIGCDLHAALALDLAEKSLVLLKNTLLPPTQLPLLPLNNATTHSIVIMGNGANETKFGDYSGTPVRPAISPLKGIQTLAASYGVSVDYIPWRGMTNNFLDESNAAKNADVVIIVAGNTWATEREGMDRMNLNLEADQVKLITEMSKINPNVIVLLNTGSVVTMTEWIDSVPALVNMWYPGESGGTAVAKLIFGEINPSGHLPLTFVKNVTQLPDFADYDISKNRTYLFMQDSPLFPFGYGLSYTNFTWSGIMINQTSIKSTQTLGVSLDITNHGPLAGDDVIQIYIRRVDNSAWIQPKLQLRGFSRVSVAVNQTKEVQIPIKMENLAIWNATSDQWIFESGQYELLAGYSATEFACNPLTFTLEN